MHNETLRRMMLTFENVGLLFRKSENRKQGFEYEIAYWDDYEKIKSGVGTLDEILVNLRETYAYG
jgi:hypothetical protein